jgi:cellobiose transport system permease protein
MTTAMSIALDPTAASSASIRPSRPSRIGPQKPAGPGVYVFLIVATVLATLPMYWTIVAASHSNGDIARTPPPFLPGPKLFSNIRTALGMVPMWKALLNSLIVSSSIALGTMFFCTLAGFAFAKLHFKGSKLLIALVVGTIAVPAQLGVIPLFILVAKIHWVNHLQAVVFPTLVSAFGVLFMRQYLTQALPNELLEAGLVDGASLFRIFWSIVLPVARPAMAVLGMITFLATWNDFFWPIIVLTSHNPTVQVALNNLGQGYVPDQSVILAGTLIGTMPVLVVFGLLGKQIVGGIMSGAVKE